MRLSVYYAGDEMPQVSDVRVGALGAFFDALASEPYPVDCVLGESREPITTRGPLDVAFPTLWAVPNAYGEYDVERWPLEQLVSRARHDAEEWRRLFWTLAYAIAPDRMDTLHYLLDPTRD